MVITALTRNQVGGNVSWVRIPPTPLSPEASIYAVFGAFLFFISACHFMLFCVILCYFLFCRRFAGGRINTGFVICNFFSFCRNSCQKMVLKIDSIELVLGVLFGLIKVGIAPARHPSIRSTSTPKSSSHGRGR